MKFWEKPLKSIFNIPARKPVRKFQTKSIELVLKKSLYMLDDQTIDKIKAFTKQQQTDMGGFADRAGKCDLYYSLFGYFIAEALDMQEVIPSLKNYVKNVVQSCDLQGVHLHTAAILYAKLFDTQTFPKVLRLKVHRDLLHSENKHDAYSGFMSMLTFYYLKDYYGLYKVQRRLKSIGTHTKTPCSVTAALMVLQECFGKPVQSLEKQLHSFLLKDGCFKAITGAPSGDLLSTGVALYALHFADSDIRIIAPDCLGYVDSLFSGGGFCATVYDVQPDVEYTFYGLMALGALTD
jgi:hypothetical protein